MALAESRHRAEQALVFHGPAGEAVLEHRRQEVPGKALQEGQGVAGVLRCQRRALRPGDLDGLESQVQPERRQATGPAPKPRWMPRPQFLYAQVIKATRRRRLVSVKHRVVFGTLEAVEQVLSACGWKINTAFIERLNLDIRHHVAAVGRRVSTLCKGEDGLHYQLSLYQSYYNFCLPHSSLRQPLPRPEPTHGTGSAKRWQSRTPAMAAGLTDRVWTLREVLLCRVPPWRQPAGV